MTIHCFIYFRLLTLHELYALPRIPFTPPHSLLSLIPAWLRSYMQNCNKSSLFFITIPSGIKLMNLGIKQLTKMKEGNEGGWIIISVRPIRGQTGHHVMRG